jgi:uncharacterized protein DUF6249
MRSEDFILGITMGLIILSGVALMITAMINRRKMREMEHRERLAMIERGLMPSPESDPGAFEAAAGFAPPPEEPGVGYRTAGVLMIGFGVGLMLLISLLSRSAAYGIGIGGVWAIIGAASLVNYYLIARREEERGQRHRWIPPVRKPPEPPPTV